MKGREAERGTGGRVEALLITPEAGAAMRRVSSVATRGLLGLEGDRYALDDGTWSENARTEPVTLIAAEDLEAAGRALGESVSPETSRRNIVTRGVDLGALEGCTFRIGGVVLEGVRPCRPCRYLETLAGLPGLKRALSGLGGLRATLRTPGTLSVGDRIEPSTK